MSRNEFYSGASKERNMALLNLKKKAQNNMFQNPIKKCYPKYAKNSSNSKIKNE
jgi:hypothetical protein